MRSALQFRPEFTAKILDGEKTVTRRTLANSQGFQRNYSTGLHAIKPGRTAKHVGHINITSITRVRLGSITPGSEVWAEGCASAHEFTLVWAYLNGEYRRDEIVYRLEFELAPSCPQCAPFDRTAEPRDGRDPWWKGRIKFAVIPTPKERRQTARSQRQAEVRAGAAR